jgi:cystathionine beta-lyase/cystathionine gamma-synthase
LTDDFAELSYLAGDLENKLQRFLKEMRIARKHINAENYGLTSDLSKIIQTTLDNIRQILSDTESRLNNNVRAETNLADLICKKSTVSEMIRFLYQTTAAEISACDWQSPSVSHSIRSLAGRMTGRIVHSVTDYKRDQHSDARIYEKLFIRENITAPLKFSIGALATSSGMAAFNTIHNYLVSENKIKSRILVGRSSYFEILNFLQYTYGNRCILTDESDTRSIIAAIRGYEPDAIFLDTIANSRKMPACDVNTVIRELSLNTKHDTMLVLDNTSAGPMFQPFNFPVTFKMPHMVVFESLNKFHQFGMDRTTGGIMYWRGPYFIGLFDYRDHLGTIIPDVSVLSIPSPNRGILEKRIRKITRNTEMLARYASESSGIKSKLIERINYPGLQDHPSYSIYRQTGFGGAFFTLDINKKFPTVKSLMRLIDVVIKNARKRKIPIVHGTSFGLDVTRIYLVASRTNEKFIRIAPGTETVYETEQLKEVLADSFFR